MFTQHIYKLVVTTLVATLSLQNAAVAAENLAMGVVNFKECFENSKLGQQEQASFDALKKQAEQVLQEKERAMRDIDSKLRDADYLDSLSPNAEAELKHQFRVLGQESQQMQQQMYQTLNQANLKILQKMSDNVNECASALAKTLKLDCIVNEESCFFYSSKLDITQKVIDMLDQTFEERAAQ